MRPRGLTKTSRRVWTLIRILALLFAIGLARQFATNVLSLHDILSDDQKAPSAPLRRGAVSSRSEQAPSVPPVPVLGELETDDPETNSVDEEEEEDALRPRREEVKVEDDVSPVLFVDEEEILPVSTPPPPPARPPPPKRSLPDLLRVMESQRSFSKSEFGYPADLIVVTQENAERLRAKLTRPERFLPELSPFASGVEGGGARHKSCALVGNAGIGRAANFGASIDRHDAVLRINQGPSKGYEKIVGSKTTYRLLNKKWASMYTSAQEGRRVFLPSEAANATILASRISGRTFEHLASVVRHARRDIRLLYVAQGLESRARNLLKAFRDASAREHPPLLYDGGDAPSSGFIGFYFLLQVCERVAVYAFSSKKVFQLNGRNWPYHYFRFTEFQGAGLHLDSEQLREHPHHSFEAEVELMALLSERTNRTRCCVPRGKFTRSKLMKCGVHDAEEEAEVGEVVAEPAEAQ